MKRLTYTGKRGGAVMVIPGFGKVERGKTIDVSDEVAEELVGRDPANFELARSSKPPADEPAEEV